MCKSLQPSMHCSQVAKRERKSGQGSICLDLCIVVGTTLYNLDGNLTCVCIYDHEYGIGDADEDIGIGLQGREHPTALQPTGSSHQRP